MSSAVDAAKDNRMDDGSAGASTGTSDSLEVGAPPVVPKSRCGPGLPTTVDVPLGQQRERPPGEAGTGCSQATSTTGASSDALLVALDDDLAAVAMATVTAMSALRQHPSGELARDAVETACDAVGSYLTQVTRLTRSTLAIRLALEAQLGAERD